MNALRNTLRGELFHALRVAESDRSVSVIIIKGNGRCFSAGYDLGGGIGAEDLPDVGPLVPGPAQWARHLNAGYFLIWDLTKVVIAQAHGYCLAGGSELASYCDLFVVADDALIGYPPVRDMSPPDNCWFPWHLPMRKAKEMIFTGDPLTGTQAAEYGLANYSVPGEELEEFTTTLAKRVALVPPQLLALSQAADQPHVRGDGHPHRPVGGQRHHGAQHRRRPVHLRRCRTRACGRRSTSATPVGVPTARRPCSATSEPTSRCAERASGRSQRGTVVAGTCWSGGWFGGGPHCCIGAASARTQLRAVIGELLTRVPGHGGRPIRRRG